MLRNIIAASLLALYVAGSVWVVRREGMAYRAALKNQNARLASRTSPPPPPSPTVANDPPEGLAFESTTPEALPTPRPESPRPATAEPGEVPPERPEAADLAGPVAPAITPAIPVGTPESSPPSPGLPPDPGSIWSTPEMTQVWDLSSLKAEDEMRLGRALHARILSFHRKVGAGTLPRRVVEAAEPFVDARTRKDIDYTFTVLDSDELNAFSHPGGYVYVTSGLIDWIGEDQIYALEFVLAHEIAHVDLGHAQACLGDPEVKKLGIGTLPQFFTLIFPRGYYPDRIDFEADRWAYQQMTRLDRTKRECLAFLRKLEGYARDHGFDEGRMWPKPGEDASPVENHLKAHPAAHDRLKKLEGLTTPTPARVP